MANFPSLLSNLYPLSLHPSTVGLGGHGPIQPAYPHHLGDQFPHLPVALPQSEPLDVHAHQPRLPRPQRQAEGGMELKVTQHELVITTRLNIYMLCTAGNVTLLSSDVGPRGFVSAGSKDMH